MSHEIRTEQPTQDLNVVADELSIYQGGNLTPVTIDDLLENEVAIRQLVNDLNRVKRESERFRSTIDQLKLERAGYALQPAILGFVAAINILGMIMVGLGTNYVTSDSPPQAAWVILAIGGLISVLTAVAPVLLPLLIEHYGKRGKNAN